MHFMRVVKRLYRLIIRLSLQAYSAFGNKIAAYNKKEQCSHSYIYLILIKRNRLWALYSFHIIRHFFQVTVHLHHYESDDGQNKRDNTEDDGVLIAAFFCCLRRFSSTGWLRFSCCIDITNYRIYLRQCKIRETGHH